MKNQEIRFETLYKTPSRNGVYKPEKYHGSGWRIVNMGELFKYNFICNQEMSRIQLTNTEMRYSNLEDGDLIFGRRSLVEEGAGKCSIVINPTESLTFESSIIRVRVDKKKVNPLFLFYYFMTNQGRGRIKAIVSGVNVKGIRGSDLKNISLSLPYNDLDGQNKLVSIISSYDDLININCRRIQLLEQSARLLFREWFVNFRFPGHEKVKIVDGMPEGWRKRRLVEIADIIMGQSPKSEYYNDIGEGLPFHQGVTAFGNRYPTNQTYCTQKNRMAQSGDILFSVRAPVGRINISTEKIIIGRGISAIRSKENHQSYLFYELKNHFFKEDMIGGGAIFAAITKKDLENVVTIYPDERAIDQFENITNPIDRQIEILSIQNQKLAQARHLLLPRLMSGAIEV